MKITMYELIGLVKDGKAPEKINYNNEIFEYNNKYQDYDSIGSDKVLFYYLFTHDRITGFIHTTVEIIEEDKKIEKCKNYENFLGIDDYIEHLKKKIDEIIDEINNLKKENNYIPEVRKKVEVE